jgi:hypothetical protein
MEKYTRSIEDKNEFMLSLKEAIENGSISFQDKNEPKINLNRYTLTEFRCYKSTHEADTYRFKSYDSYFKESLPYKNGELQKMECGILCAYHKHKDKDGFITNPNTFYILFAN